LHDDRTMDRLGPLPERGAALGRPPENVALLVDSSDGPPSTLQRPAYGPRSTRVRRRASFWVAHCVGLIVGAGCVLVLAVALGIALWHVTSTTTGNAGPGMSVPPGYANQQLIFDDQFSGTTLDTTKWTTYLGAQGIVWNDKGNIPLPDSAPNVIGNGIEAAMFAPTQVSVNNGLTLTAQHNTNRYANVYPWISGVVTTEGKLSLPSTGWYVQVKAKMPDMTAGMWPAVWFMPAKPGGRAPEIDQFEGGWLGSNPNELMHADYGGSASQYAGYRDVVYHTASDLSASYHVYAVQYVPHVAVKYFLDGKLIFEQLQSNRGGVAAGTYELLLELQVASHSASAWHTVPTGTTGPARMEIAEVQVYS
jgi:Glycosyl hydrolases family 16